MKHGSLFSGIGGFDLAAEWMGWENTFHCEFNPFGQKVLKYYWPNAISYTDIKSTAFDIHRDQIDILTGGFPCQPYSTAGKRLGKEDERHLWPHMLRAIQEIRPRWVVGENVRGLISWNDGMVFDEVQSDLENEGYEVFPVLLPACGVDAPHRRERIWFIAFNSLRQSNGEHHAGESGRTWMEMGGSLLQKTGWEESSISLGSSSFSRSIAYSQGQRRGEAGENISRSEKWSSGNGSEWYTSDSDQFNGDLSGLRTSEVSQQQKASIFGSHLSRWRNFPTQSPVCSGNDGFPSGMDGDTLPKWKSESIKAAGNAVVPQVVYQIFKTIEAFDQSYSTTRSY